ncbi:MAG: hypothetical protein DWH91_01875 [Planctomycetota bacterium]|nr:MAG: hypothetical protein DWH91_01875 [Planctomycetota bacterium]
MPKVFIPASLRLAANGLREVELPGATVRELVLALEQRFPALKGRLREEDKLRAGLAVSIDSTVSLRGLMQEVAPSSEVHFLAAIGGG